MFMCDCQCLSAYLGLVPVLRFLHVLGGNGLILGPDVPQSTSKVRPGGAFHLHLQMLGLDTHLNVLDFLIKPRCTTYCQEYNIRISTIKKKPVYPSTPHRYPPGFSFGPHTFSTQGHFVKIMLSSRY